MASILNATTSSGLVTSADNSGSLQLATNNGTTAVTIDTSQRAAFVAGTAALPAITTTGDTNTGIFFPAADTIAFAEGGAESMRIDSSGRVLIGTTTGSPATSDNYGVVVGTTESNTVALGVIQASASGTSALVLNRGASDGSTVSFYRAAVPVGTISVTSSATSYNTSSDYRLKENIAPMTGALVTVSALKPVTYKWKVDGSNGQGFIAHELQAVVPDCVTGKKDDVDADEKPIYQGIDTSFLVATLTAAIQELKAELDATKAEVQALKGTL